MNLHLLKIMKLEGSADYSEWKNSMKFLLIGYNVWGVVNGDLIKPEPILDEEMTTILNPEYSGWIKDNNKAMSAIALNVSSEVAVMIVDFNTAKRMWDYLFSQWLCAQISNSSTQNCVLQTGCWSDLQGHLLSQQPQRLLHSMSDSKTFCCTSFTTLTEQIDDEAS